MAKQKGEDLKNIKDDSKSKNSTLLDECEGHYSASDKWLENIRETWDSKEALLLGRAEDAITKKSKSKISDPRLSTIVFERAARVMNRNPSGKAYAESEDDIGKNMFMNLLLPHYRKKDTEPYSHLLKLRFMDLYSMVYGTSFGLVPWRVNTRTGFIGPSLINLKMRDCKPQPGVASISESDFFDHDSWVSMEWLEQQDAQYWDREEITLLKNDLKEAKSSGDQKSNDREKEESFIERDRYPDNPIGSARFPRVKLITEYRADKWITWTPQLPNSKTSRPYILRVVENPYPDGMSPIITKHSFPLLDSLIGLGEFERGETLQHALNSLINLYMDGVKYSIFPPVAIDPNNVVPSSIKWGAGERWYMNNPQRDVQALNLAPQGLQTFQSTYEFMLGALYNQSGTTSVAGDNGGGSNMGRTPEAIKFVQERETARDEWDRFMMEDTLNQLYSRWMSLITNNLDSDVELRLFGVEAQKIAKRFPDVKDILGDKWKMYKSGEQGALKVNKDLLGGPNQKYDWIIETGSTTKPNLEADADNLTTVLRAVTENEKVLPEMRARGKDIDFGELMQRWMEAGLVKDTDKIIVDYSPQTAESTAAGGNADAVVPPADGSVPPEVAAAIAQAGGGAPVNAAPVAQVAPTTAPVADVVPPQVAIPTDQIEMPQFSDPQIAEIAQKVLGGMSGIPPA